MVRPGLLTKIFPKLTWKQNAQEGEIFLTFDDGPVPGVTPWVLEQLEEFDAKATFFCLGKNVKENPEIYQSIIDKGHSVGNHSYSHIKGWFKGVDEYLEDVYHGSEHIDSNLFRPPYGRITTAQANRVSKEFHVVMWSVLSKDYDSNIPGIECFLNVRNNVESGSIIVFHDSYKAQKNLKFALPMVLDHFTSMGYTFKALNYSPCTQPLFSPESYPEFGKVLRPNHQKI
jgi:peptidoglycan/xylan/chitin deacetylase (PgdA/CDA1 family)